MGIYIKVYLEIDIKIYVFFRLLWMNSDHCTPLLEHAIEMGELVSTFQDRDSVRAIPRHITPSLLTWNGRGPNYQRSIPLSAGRCPLCLSEILLKKNMYTLTSIEEGNNIAARWKSTHRKWSFFHRKSLWVSWASVCGIETFYIDERNISDPEQA